MASKAGKMFTPELNRDLFEDGLELARRRFDICSVYDDQRAALLEFFCGKNVYFSAPCGYGWIADAVNGTVDGWHCAIVISPLISLMEEHVKFLTDTVGCTAVALNKNLDEKSLHSLQRYPPSFLFASPESLLSMSRWRKLISDSEFRTRCVAVVIDEAHIIRQWRTAMVKNKLPFREWYAQLGELRSLLTEFRFAVFTATATTATKHVIIDTLGLRDCETYMIEKSPVKSNLRFSVCYVGRNVPLRQIFSMIIGEVRNNNVNVPTTFIFCQTRKQAAVIFNAFAAELQKLLFLNSNQNVRERVVEMYHAGTPENVKQHIVEDVSSASGHIRVLICTIAFGMGINCGRVSRTIHFGPSKTLECYLQECGRAGRRGQESTSIVFHNGFLDLKCSDDIKCYLYSKSCRRQHIVDGFPKEKNAVSPPPCKCCDNCQSNCQCEVRHCDLQATFHIQPEVLGQKTAVRNVSKEQLEHLESLLVDYKKSLTADKPLTVSLPNTFFEFTAVQIRQVLENCTHISDDNDLMQYVEIWRRKHCHAVMKALSLVFPDIRYATCDSPRSESNGDDFEEPGGWSQILEDSDFVRIPETDTECSVLDTPGGESSQVEAQNLSGVIEKVATRIEFSST